MLDKYDNIHTIINMSLLDVQNQIIGSLLENDIFGKDEMAKVKIDDRLSDNRDDVMRAVMQMLVDANVVRKVGDDIWVLIAPLNSSGQEIHLSMPVCSEIAEVLNMDLESKGINERVSSLGIDESHIIGLLSIINELLSRE